MDQVKIGAFIAQLRREKGWTQEELGERLGVTNKTVSRWENGNYMPGIEMLLLMGREFDMSLNELLEGQRLEDEEEFRAAADKNLASAMVRPIDKFWRWVERYGAYASVVLLLCVIIAGLAVGYTQYYQKHPLDVQTPCTFACRNFIYHEGQYIWMYFTFDHDGRYYIFDAGGNVFETGRYARDGDVITLEDGEAVRWVVVKGRQIRDTAPWGEELLTYELVSGVPMFVNFDREDYID